MRNKAIMASLLTGLVAATITVGMTQPPANAASMSSINTNSDHVLEQLKNKNKNVSEAIDNAKGVLIFPGVVQAGIGIGGQYGQGELMIDGKADSYYSLRTLSGGFQLGAQKKAIVLAFTTDDALANFRKSRGFTIGADASVAVINLGGAGYVSANNLNKPVLAFIVDQRGLMYNLSLQGTKITKLNKK